MIVLYKNFLRSFLLVVFCITSGFSFAPSLDFLKIQRLINKGENYNAIKCINSTSIATLSKVEQARAYYLLGEAYGNENENDKSYTNFITSERLYISLGNTDVAMEIKLEIAYALSLGNYNDNTIKNYFLEYINYAESKQNPELLAKGYYKFANFLIYNEPQKAKTFYFKALYQIGLTKNEYTQAAILSNLAALYNVKFKQPDTAILYLQKSLAIAEKNNYKDLLCSGKINIATIYSDKKEYIKAIHLLQQADKLKISSSKTNIKSRIHFLLSTNYAELHQYQKAYEELETSQELSDNENQVEQTKVIADLQTKYDIKNKELENYSLKIKNRNGYLLLYLTIGLFVIAAIVAYLIIYTLKKKNKIAEQEKFIESQKLANLLKEHELKEIDKLLEGQEKERIRIANDLHDNLGSMMATLKLNFQNLKLNSESLNPDLNQLFDKTDALLEESYQKVRSIAHTQNAGVFANEGLLPAVKNIAKKASIPGVLEVHVIPFGLEERLENTIEVNIFRMIQEILANAIKHAHATEINIHMTQHSDSLNIIIDDNGLGFAPKEFNLSEGMGLFNIEKKIESMGGLFSVDSTIGNGTSVVIDIPI